MEPKSMLKSITRCFIIRNTYIVDTHEDKLQLKTQTPANQHELAGANINSILNNPRNKRMINIYIYIYI